MRIYGRNSIAERLKINSQSIQCLLLDKGKAPRELEFQAKNKRIPVRYLTEREFEKACRGIRSQGIVAEVEDFKYDEFEDIISAPKEKPPTLLFLDNFNDPQNLGAVLRSAACFGGFAIVLPKHDSVEVTEAVLRVASGGENYVRIARVNNLSNALEAAKKHGYWIAGAVTEGGQNLTKASLSFPLSLVIGSEAKGIRPGLIKHLDFRLIIPMQGAGLSFNVAAATAIFCYEIARQRKGWVVSKREE